MKESLKMTLTLMAICLVAGLLLAAVNEMTREPIARAQAAEKADAIRRVLPQHDNDPMKTVFIEKEGQIEWKFHVARKGSEFAGAAVEAVTDQGYGGEIKVMVGINAAGAVERVEVLSHKETPGLGAKIVASDFVGQFRGKPAADTSWCAVRKDGGAVDAVTGATISSRAVASAVKAALDTYAANAGQIRQTGISAP